MTSQSPANPGFKAFLPLLGVFFILNAGFFFTRSLLAKYNVSADVLLVGNIILFTATAVSFYFYYKSYDHNKSQAFLSYIYLGMLVKMLLCLFSAFIYIRAAGKEVNKPAVIGCMIIYLLYTILEVLILTKLSKQKKNV
jgi:hypothetical protein